MSSTLYIVSRPLDDRARALIPPSTSSDPVQLLLIEDGVRSPRVPSLNTSVLAEDASARGIPISNHHVSYADMVRMIFAADRVVVI